MESYYATFPGLQITRADMLFTYGIDPSVAVVHAVAVDQSAAYGDLVFGSNESPLITFKDCALDKSSITPPLVKRGFRMRVNILDRRWKWRYQLISGRYNVRLSDSTIREDTETTYQELLEIVLEALGETEYDIEIPEPDLAPPEVHWYKQRADLQLAWLCDRIGCLVTLGLDNRIKILTNGSGDLYPANGLELEPFFNTVPTAIPKEVVATYAPTRFQMKVLLEAVGIDTDGTVKPIDDLSYAPSDWTLQVPGIFNDVEGDEERELARRSVYRWYRVKEFAGGGVDLPVEDYTITTIDDILPILPGLVVKTENNYPQRPYLEGYFFNGDLAGENEEEGEFSRWDDDFDIDYEHGIIKLPYCVFNLDGEGNQGPATLYLTCSFNARSDPMSGWWGHDFPVLFNENGAGNQQVEEACMFRYVVQEYDEANPTTVSDNKEDVDEHGELLANSYMNHLNAIPQMSMQWNGIIPYPVAGNIHQMRWRVGGGPAITWGGKNLEYLYMSPSYSERKLRHEVARSLHL